MALLLDVLKATLIAGAKPLKNSNGLRFARKYTDDP
ncbi:potassium/proton antiporter [Bacillus sp. NRRL B-14911]|nr:potassium/proton antiporter [Bacillus sp. NRRL B-14911]